MSDFAGNVAWRKKSNAKKAVESPMLTKQAKAIKLITRDEAVSKAIRSDEEALYFETSTSNPSPEVFRLPIATKDLFPSELEVKLETKGQDETPDGMLEESGMQLRLLKDHIDGLKMIPNVLVAEVIY